MAHDDLAAIAGEIERYLRTHPAAADTIEGIRQWWVPHLHAGRTDVEAALASLVAAGRVVALRVSGGEVVYQAAPTRGGS